MICIAKIVDIHEHNTRCICVISSIQYSHQICMGFTMARLQLAIVNKDLLLILYIANVLLITQGLVEQCRQFSIEYIHLSTYNPGQKLWDTTHFNRQMVCLHLTPLPPPPPLLLGCYLRIKWEGEVQLNPDNSNLFRFPLKVRVIRIQLYKQCSEKYPIQ